MKFTMRRKVIGVLGVTAATAGTMLASAGAAGAATTSAAVPHAHAAHAVRSAPTWPWPVVRFGDHGNRVFAIQYLLRARGFTVGPSGVFGGITRHDVARFQKLAGLNPNGVVGTATWERLIITVAFGSRGEAVKGVQQNLHFGYGYKNLPVTGFFGHITRGDVINFQRRHHIGVDGIVGIQTWFTIIRFES